MSLRDPQGKKSTMRVSLYWIIGMAAGLVLAIMIAVVVQALNGAVIDWQGIALAIGAIGVFVAPALGFKALQKRFEQ